MDKDSQRQVRKALLVTPAKVDKVGEALYKLYESFEAQQSGIHRSNEESTMLFKKRKFSSDEHRFLYSARTVNME
ncbi:unnamed protein product [Nippostrongylus brasiliensis]|uniref:Ovule protein n=1 Tax=Nippostrongylus brasiliensis TaxID=27835 RepID=A0A0N4XX25_NIPBR|nr:unnamed protein product [Nippostrongylus brasiliensis]